MEMDEKWSFIHLSRQTGPASRRLHCFIKRSALVEENGRHTPTAGRTGAPRTHAVTANALRPTRSPRADGGRGCRRRRRRPNRLRRAGDKCIFQSAKPKVNCISSTALASLHPHVRRLNRLFASNSSAFGSSAAPTSASIPRYYERHFFLHVNAE